MTLARACIRVLVILLLASSVFAGVSAAEEQESLEQASGGAFTGVGTVEEQESLEQENEGVVEINLEPVVEALETLVDSLENWDEDLADVLRAVLFHPYQVMAQQLLEVVVTVLTTTPDVHNNPPVEEVHGEVLFITYLLGTVVFMVAGILHMIGPVLGISYGQVRMILPRLILALVVAAFSLPLMQIFVDLTNALVAAFTPSGLRMSVAESLGLTSGLVLAYVLKSVLLLVLVAVFIMRAIYILFGAAISPLLALMWSIPRFKRYADTFIAGWFAALLIAPLDLLVLNFALAMMSGEGITAFQAISNWILGVASLTLLLIVPYQVWSASQTIVGQTYRASNSVQQRIESPNSDQITDEDLRRELQKRRRRQRRRGNRRYNSFNNRERYR